MLTSDNAIIRKRCLDEWGTSIPVMTDFGPAQARPTGLHVHFAIKAEGTDHRAGDRKGGIVNRFGRVWLTIYAPKGTGEKAITDTADKFARIFRNWQSPDFAIDFSTEDYGSSGEDPNTGFLYWQLSVYYQSVRPYSTDI